MKAYESIYDIRIYDIIYLAERSRKTGKFEPTSGWVDNIVIYHHSGQLYTQLVIKRSGLKTVQITIDELNAPRAPRSYLQCARLCRLRNKSLEK